jgi:hypothetical protein
VVYWVAMRCALCKGSKPVVNSHIIPEFMYSRMDDAQHRFFVVSSNPSVNDRLLQKGLREQLL